MSVTTADEGSVRSVASHRSANTGTAAPDEGVETVTGAEYVSDEDVHYSPADESYSWTNGPATAAVVNEITTALTENQSNSVKAWDAAYRRRVIVTDSVAVAITMVVSQLLIFRYSDAHLAGTDGVLSYTLISVLLGAGWISALAISGSWAREAFRSRFTEHRRLLRAAFGLFGIVALISLLGQVEMGRGYLATALAVGLVLLGLDRSIWHAWRARERRQGRQLAQVLIIGGRLSAAALADNINKSTATGYRVAGLCVPRLETSPVDRADTINGFPVFGDLDEVIAAIDRSKANVVAVAASDAYTAQHVRDLSWQLVGTGIGLMLAPAITDVAGPRIHMEPLPGLPLMRVEEPRFQGPKVVMKTALDIVGVIVGLVAFSPLLLLVAIIIKISDRGPVFFRQVRVGRGGRTFRIWKFRSMVQNAHLTVDEVRAAAGQGESVFFKSSNDARITPVGRVLRKTSIDELPQLFNVLTGHMSLVGPRPLVPGEGAEIGGFLERRMRVKPGLTGLWQVSGRSDIDTDQRIALDLYYVENWSVSGDLAIIAKTIKTVLTNEGAY